MLNQVRPLSTALCPVVCLMQLQHSAVIRPLQLNKNKTNKRWSATEFSDNKNTNKKIICGSPCSSRNTHAHMLRRWISPLHTVFTLGKSYLQRGTHICVVTGHLRSNVPFILKVALIRKHACCIDDLCGCLVTRVCSVFAVTVTIINTVSLP